ncbi:MAG TPA: SpoIID/LytB domain-containing protein [Candidatus Babeliales bacterium]|nr:SpoIID/LytB domain-containing protein [Candidatus Babeliales bacterium]
MISYFKLLPFLLPLSIFCQSNQTHVKVLLKEVGGNDFETVNISSSHGIVVDTKEDGHPKRSYYFKNSVPLLIDHQVVSLSKKKIKTKHPIRINAFDGHIRYNHEDYFGIFYIMFHDNKVYLVNKVELENYIYSVLRTEGWPGWPLEVNKVFAITCRSYVIKKILEARTSKKPFHIKNSNAHQTYRGIRHNNIHKQAVDETAGIFLGHKNQPIAAMFDSCCGGVSPSQINGELAGVNFKKAPYLARKKICTHCKKCKIFNWGFEFPLKEFERRFATIVPELEKLTNITIAKKDSAGLVHKLTLHYRDKKKKIVEGKKLYKLFKEVKSSVFTITKKKEHLVIKGHGYGHHLGLCQWGAWQMVKDGWNYTRILHFFYPDTTFMQLKHKDGEEE